MTYVMEHIERAIDRVINSIDWKKIKNYHKKLNLWWEFEEDKGAAKRIPTIAELKEDLTSIIYHMRGESLDYISYGNWIIFWDSGSKGIGDMRVIFRLADFHFEENRNSQESLQEALRKAIDREDYEYAALLRDTLNKQDNK